jgi:four helix bundle protein
VKSHEDLIVWQMSIEFVTNIYKSTKQFPQEELYGLTSQIRRAAVSIPSNISEGAARNSTKEYIQFLYIALGSTAEVETQLIISENLKYLNDNTLREDAKNIKGKLINLIASLKRKV